ncbi:hypothetical protein PIB30_052889 [Stylosanthes scabra]|uniref:Uncharacterized protein n=1 Tax=Stylosanthes scabra TaxID=79078 RepID=A0ABU6QJ18_9FABA|nr:hypothetical protein [Stylosanthes scabra]
MYGWVKEVVLSIPSSFVDMESVRRLGELLSWVRSGKNLRIEFLPCSISERCSPRLKLLTLFKGSYTDFKSFYIKVKLAEETFPFFLDENLSRRFPLYRNRKLVQCLGIEELCEKDAGLSEFLFEAMKSGKLLSTSELVKWEQDRDATKVSDCSAAGLKSFFKQWAEKELSTSNIVKVKQGSDVNKPSNKRKPISLKRMKSEEASMKKVIDLIEEDLSSVWCEHYPFAIVADEHFQSKADLDLLGKAGKVATARYMQVQATRLMCIRWGWEVQAL